MNKQIRQIESFELSKNYYSNSWINGNKSHIADELSELMLCNLIIAIEIISDLPKDAKKFVLESKQFRQANLRMTVALLK